MKKWLELIRAWLERLRKKHEEPKEHGPIVAKPDERVTLEELRARQRFAVDHIHFPWGYTAAKLAAEICRGGRPRLDGIGSGEYTLVSLPLYVWLHGDAAAKEQARAYYRSWLAQEKGGDWRKSSMVCSLNHQLTRAVGIYGAMLALGPAEAARCGDSSKTSRAKEMLLSILTGGGWWDAYGNRITEGPCACATSAGKHPEPPRSRHYGPRCIDSMWAVAECGDPDVERAAQAELDNTVAAMRPGVRSDGLLDPTILPEFRADTGTRCPQYCPDVLKRFGLACGPGETPGIVYIWFKREWRLEFDGSDPRCDCAEQYYFQAQYIFGEKWRPLLK